jgi:glutaredoxin
MTRCPQCTKTLAELTRQCPYCKADLDLLVDYVGQLRANLERAERLTREGELGQAVWAYLAVLEVDPDNAEARRQVGQVATAVRQFDRNAPGRRWLARMRKEADEEETAGPLLHWLRYGLVVGLLAAAFVLGLVLGGHAGSSTTTAPPPLLHDHTPTLGGP